MKQYRAAIQDIAYYLPEIVCDNESLVKSMDMVWSAEEISKKTGIQSRHIAGPNECASDLGIAAARKLFLAGSCYPEEIDFLLFCTQSPDYFLPATACIMQKELGLKKTCGALDYNQGCSGFVYGLALAKGLVETGIATKILLITAETYSKYMNDKDRSTRTIFGDGAAATLITAVEHECECIGPMVFGTDGTGAKNLIVPAGGMRLPISSGTSVEVIDADVMYAVKLIYIWMDQKSLILHYKVIPKMVQELMAKTNQSIETIDYFIFHQANKFILEHLRKKMKIPEEKFWINLQNSGNTVSASIPIALKMARDSGVIKTGDCIMLVGFGVGYSWGATMVKMI